MGRGGQDTVLTWGFSSKPKGLFPNILEARTSPAVTDLNFFLGFTGKPINFCFQCGLTFNIFCFYFDCTLLRAVFNMNYFLYGRKQ